MISFRFKNQTKKVKIKTKQRLDERMSHWLQKVFSFKNQIIGFKSQDSTCHSISDRVYDVVENFFGSHVEIIEAGDQIQISCNPFYMPTVTSQNLNSSSFMRPSQPNTSEINHKELSEDQFEDFTAVNDRKSFEKKLIDGKDISLLFDVNNVYRKTLTQNSNALFSPSYNFKINLYMYINNSHPKKSCLSIYIGKTCVITFPIFKNYIEKIKDFLNRYKNSTVLAERQNKLFFQAKASLQQQDDAPSFTTYHLQQRLNQDACIEYLSKMYKQEKSLRNYEYRKLMEKCEQNFSQFYRIFCEGVLDNDFECFRNQILQKVENNLELILSNVDEMDLSRPISREQQRRNNLKKSVPEIEIVKVQNYFEILDQLKNEITQEAINEIKQLLLDQDKQISGYFSQYLSREISQQTLSSKLNSSMNKRKNQKMRPNSRYIPSRLNKSKSVDPARQKLSDQMNEEKKLNHFEPLNNNVEEPPMFGSIKQQQNFSPIKYMSDIESNYKQAWGKLSQKGDQFQPEQYGLLYHYLQKRDDSISNFIQQLEWNELQSIENIKKLLGEKIQAIFLENFTSAQINLLDSIRHTHAVNCIFQNFKYESDLTRFISSLKEQLQNNQSQVYETKKLHKKSSDSQLLQNKDKKANRYTQRKFSNQNQLIVDQRSPFPSPKDSQYSLYNKKSQIPDFIEIVKKQWSNEFQEMLKDINFTEDKKEELIRELYSSGSAKIFGWVRNYLKGHQQYFSSQQIYNLNSNEKDTKFLVSILPIYNEFLRIFVEDGLLTEKIRKWVLSEVICQNMTLISCFELFIQTKQEEDFIETLKMTYESQNSDMQFYNLYLKRLESLLKQISINDEVGLEVFSQFSNSIKAVCELYFITGNLEDMMDTLELLYKKQSELRNIKIATLNFSGINTNPFEYHDGTQEADSLNHLFLANLTQLKPQLSEWKIGLIDKEVQNRMSICFAEGFQLSEDNKLPNRKQFEEIWRLKFPESSKLKHTPTEQQKSQCILMDYLIYLTVVQHVFQITVSSLEVIESKIKELDAERFLRYLSDKKNKPQCKLSTKSQKVIEYILKNNLDVMFLQEAGPSDWPSLLPQQYVCIKNNDSLIIYKQLKIGNIKPHLQQKYAQELNFNSDSAYAFTDKGYLLVSAHLKSSKQHIEQAKDMFISLEKILADHPMLKLIIGIDANHFIQDDQIPVSVKLKRIPLTEQIPTTIKRRTYLQAQFGKSNVEIALVKDLVITNRNIPFFSIQNIKGQQINKANGQYLPNQDHPYDHLIVMAEIV